MLSARSQEAKPGVNGGKGAPERSGGVFFGAQRKPLRRRVAQPPGDASRSDSALDAHVSISERGKERCEPDGGSRADHRLEQRRLTDKGREAARQQC